MHIISPSFNNSVYHLNIVSEEVRNTAVSVGLSISRNKLSKELTYSKEQLYLGHDMFVLVV